MLFRGFLLLFIIPILVACEITPRSSVSLAPVSRAVVQTSLENDPPGFICGVSTTGVRTSPKYYDDELNGDDLVIGTSHYASDDRPICRDKVAINQFGHMIFDLGPFAPARHARDDIGNGHVVGAIIMGQQEDAPQTMVDPNLGCRESELGRYIFGATTGSLNNLNGIIPIDNLDHPPPRTFQSSGIDIDDTHYSTEEFILLNDSDDVFVTNASGTSDVLLLTLNENMLDSINRTLQSFSPEAPFLWGLTLFPRLDVALEDYTQDCYTRLREVRLLLFFEPQD
ncbi:hypothetical protein [Halioxenophilus aromaticivorans]|uniref:Uncharacterized protein n=1 Tax=Halioxenophilus aromaticivorans TaxID=1306992 RepID=A0AAV3TXH1_9ALTE